MPKKNPKKTATFNFNLSETFLGKKNVRLFIMSRHFYHKIKPNSLWHYEYLFNGPPPYSPPLNFLTIQFTYYKISLNIQRITYKTNKHEKFNKIEIEKYIYTKFLQHISCHIWQFFIIFFALKLSAVIRIEQLKYKTETLTILIVSNHSTGYQHYTYVYSLYGKYEIAQWTREIICAIPEEG